MEEGSESKFWTIMKRIFGSKYDLPLEEVILEAKAEGVLKSYEVSMLLNVLQLGQKQAHEIMIPRTDLVCAEIEDTLDEVAKLIIESGHSRIPIYKDNRDNIVGIVHAKDLLKYRLIDRAEQVTLKDIIRAPLFVPDTKNIREILLEFQSRKVHMAIVLDEYGGTSGIVTLEDVLEEIVGEIEDEYDRPRPEEIIKQSDGSYLVTGRTYLEDLNEQTELELESEQVETISGYLCQLAGKVPQKGEKIVDDRYEYEIQDADAKHVRWLIIRKLKSE